MSNSSVSPSSGGISNSSLSLFLAVTADFCNAFLNLFNISSNFSSGIIIYSTFLGLSSGFTLFEIVTTSAISFLKNSPALYITFLEAIFKEPTPVFNNYTLYFLKNCKSLNLITRYHNYYNHQQEINF